MENKVSLKHNQLTVKVEHIACDTSTIIYYYLQLNQHESVSRKTYMGIRVLTRSETGNSSCLCSGHICCSNTHCISKEADVLRKVLINFRADRDTGKVKLMSQRYMKVALTVSAESPTFYHTRIMIVNHYTVFLAITMRNTLRYAVLLNII